jgi:hypothetical protein
MASVGDGFTGDIAIDDLSFMDCTLYPGKREHFKDMRISKSVYLKEIPRKPILRYNRKFPHLYSSLKLLTLEIFL